MRFLVREVEEYLWKVEGISREKEGKTVRNIEENEEQ